MVDFSIDIEHIKFSIFPDNTISIIDTHDYGNYSTSYECAVFE